MSYEKKMGRPKTLKDYEVKKACNILLSFENKNYLDEFCSKFGINKSQFLTLLIEKLIKGYVISKDLYEDEDISIYKKEANLMKKLIELLQLKESSVSKEEAREIRSKKSSNTFNANYSRNVQKMKFQHLVKENLILNENLIKEKIKNIEL